MTVASIRRLVVVFSAFVALPRVLLAGEGDMPSFWKWGSDRQFVAEVPPRGVVFLPAANS